MTRTTLLVALLCALSFSCKKKSTVIVCTPIDAGVATDAGVAGTTDAGITEDAGDSGTDDGGDPAAGPSDNDAGFVLVDGGTFDSGIAMPTSDGGDAGFIFDAGDAGNIICQEMELSDAGVCRDVPCDTTNDCCDGTTCIQNTPAVCLYCELPQVSDCLTSSPCGIQTQNTCITVGLADAGCGCPSGPKSVCAPLCQTNGCPSGFICNLVTQLCDAEPCRVGYVCPEWTTCNMVGSGPNHGCEPKSCVDDSDCIGAHCINGVCGQFTGTCQY